MNAILPKRIRLFSVPHNKKEHAQQSPAPRLPIDAVSFLINDKNLIDEVLDALLVDAVFHVDGRIRRVPFDERPLLDHVELCAVHDGMVFLLRHLRSFGVRALDDPVARLGVGDKGDRRARLSDVANQHAEFGADLSRDALRRDVVKLARRLALCQYIEMVKGCDAHRRLRHVALDAVDIALKNEVVRVVVTVASVTVIHVDDGDIRIAVVLDEAVFELPRDVQTRPRPCARNQKMRDVFLPDLDFLAIPPTPCGSWQ